MKSSLEKCHLLVSTNDNVAIRIGSFQIENSNREKLLGIQFGNNLSFDNLSEICKKASRKLFALSRVTAYMNLPKRKILTNVFFNSQFNYCSLIWMYHSRIIKEKNKQTT